MHRMHFEHVRLDLISLVILYNFDHHTKYSTESEWKRVDIQSLSPTLTIHSIAPKNNTWLYKWLIISKSYTNAALM